MHSLEQSEVPNGGQLPSRAAVMYSFLRKALLFAAIGGGALPLRLPGQSKVYLVVGSDTAVWNFPGGVDGSKYHRHLSADLSTLPQYNPYKVQDHAFRHLFSYSSR